MDINNGIDSKPRMRLRGRRRASDRISGFGGEHNDDAIDDADIEQVLNVRVKERESDAGRKNRLSGLFKEPPSTAIKGLKEQGQELKETIKRPLTGLFRRPGSRAGPTGVSRKEPKVESDAGNVEIIPTNYTSGPERSVSPEVSQVEKHIIHDSIAKAPNVSVNKVATMYQLDAMNSKNACISKLDDIDISLLSRYLCADDEVKDEGVVWSWDYVFASICTEMREEWALDDEQEDENYERNQPQ